MSKEPLRFLFTFSVDGIKKLEEGSLVLSSGGLRRPNGSLYEMASPILFDSKLGNTYSKLSADEVLSQKVDSLTYNFNQIIENQKAFKNVAWMNYAVAFNTYEMTYQGFQITLQNLETLGVQLSEIKKDSNNRTYNDHLEHLNRYKNYLNSIAGYMESKSFSATDHYMDIVPFIDEIDAYFKRLHNELKTNEELDSIILGSIVFLVGPYTYIIRKYATLYYYENEDFPPNYDTWMKTLSFIANSYLFNCRLQAFLRINLDCSLEDVLKVKKLTTGNIFQAIKGIRFDQEYALHHTKEEYLSINRQLKEKIDTKDYKLINSRICIEL